MSRNHYNRCQVLQQLTPTAPAMILNRPLAPSLLYPALLATTMLAGCDTKTGGTSAPAAGTAKDEEQVRQVFLDFQSALKARDPDKVWALLDADSQAEAERAAQAIQAAYAKATAAEKAEMEKALGLDGKELAALKGPGFLKSKRFHGKYDEVPESKLEKVTVQGDAASVNYTEPDGDKEKFSLVRQEGHWKLSIPMPKGSQP